MLKYTLYVCAATNVSRKLRDETCETLYSLSFKKIYGGAKWQISNLQRSAFLLLR